MIGGSGNDIFHIDDAGDSISEASAGGTGGRYGDLQQDLCPQ